LDVDTRLLDVACGTGKLLEMARCYGLKPENLAGIDLTPAMIEKARGKKPLLGASLFQGDVAELPWGEGSFDVVTTTFSFHHLASPNLYQKLEEYWILEESSR